MLVILHALLWAIVLVSVVYVLWNLVGRAMDEDLASWKRIIVASIISVVFILALVLVSIKVEILEADATITSFETVKERKNELGDNYVIEPSILSDYAKALRTKEFYKKVGILN